MIKTLAYKPSKILSKFSKGACVLYFDMEILAQKSIVSLRVSLSKRCSSYYWFFGDIHWNKGMSFICLLRDKNC